MAAYNLDGNVTDQNGASVAGALVYVYDYTGELASLTDSLGQDLANPVTSGEDGYWSAFVGQSGFYTLKYLWGGRMRLIEAGRPIGEEALAGGVILEARDTALEARSVAVAARDEAAMLGSGKLYASWADASADTFGAGDSAIVVATDTGTHTDPVVGGTVNNAGYYRYSSSPAGLERIGNLESQLAADAAATMRFVADVLIENAAGVAAGGYYAAIATPGIQSTARFYGRVIGGSGSANVTVIVNNVPVYGPVAVGTAGTDTSPALTIAANSDVEFLVESPSATITALYVKIEGLPS